MSTTDEALKLVQEALESMQIVDFSVENLVGWNKAINAIKQARSTPVQDSDHEFENFHRLLCERFGYTHDEVDWKRDQISLIEWIAKQVKPAAPVQEPWGACVFGRVFVGRLPEHARKFSEEQGVPIQWLYTAPPAAPAPEGMVLVPRDLVGAACAAIEGKRDAPKTLEQLRRYTTGDLSTPPAAQVLAVQEPKEISGLVEGMEVSIDVSTGDHDSGNRLFGTVTLVQENQGSKHGLILLVQDPEANFKTAAPPAVPLTDNQIDQVANSILTADPVHWWRQLARAIEAAHGITGKGQNGPATLNQPPT
jgi:hypothetical protein